MKKEPHPTDLMTWKERQKYKPEPKFVSGTQNPQFVDKETNKLIGFNNRNGRRRIGKAVKK